MTLEVFQAGLIGVLIGAAIVALGVLLHNCISGIFKRLTQIEEENEQIKKQNKSLQLQIDELIAVKERSRQTGSTMAGLEEAMAHIIRIKYNRDVDNHALECAINMLQTLRKGPYAYDPNKQTTEERKEYL
jgi:gas vesicle protein